MLSKMIRLTGSFDTDTGQDFSALPATNISAYFPEGCVLSLLTLLDNGDAIETANIGREGAFGLFSAMYSRSSFKLDQRRRGQRRNLRRCRH